jgi:hypothetical protein
LRCIPCLASLLALALVRPAPAAVANGSFELVSASAPAESTASATNIPGWQASGNGLLWLDAAAEGLVAPNGDRVVRFAPGSGPAAWLQQAIATTPGESYDLLFWIGSRAGARGPGRAGVHVEVAGTARPVTIENRSRELLWQAHVVTFTATAPVTTLAFRGEPGARAAAWLDDVAVRPAATARGALPGPR